MTSNDISYNNVINKDGYNIYYDNYLYNSIYVKKIEIINNELSELDLSGLNIIIFNTNLLNDLIKKYNSLKKINVSYNHIKNFNIPYNIEEVDLSHNYLTTIHFELPENNDDFKLKKINISDNLLTNIDLLKLIEPYNVQVNIKYNICTYNPLKLYIQSKYKKKAKHGENATILEQKNLIIQSNHINQFNKNNLIDIYKNVLFENNVQVNHYFKNLYRSNIKNKIEYIYFLAYLICKDNYDDYYKYIHKYIIQIIETFINYKNLLNHFSKKNYDFIIKLINDNQNKLLVNHANLIKYLYDQNDYGFKEMIKPDYTISYRDLGPYGIYLQSIIITNNNIEELDLSGLNILEINDYYLDNLLIQAPLLKKINLSYNHLYKIELPWIHEEFDLSHNYLNQKNIKFRVPDDPNNFKLKKVDLSDNLIENNTFIRSIHSYNVEINFKYNLCTYNPLELSKRVNNKNRSRRFGVSVLSIAKQENVIIKSDNFKNLFINNNIFKSKQEIIIFFKNLIKLRLKNKIEYIYLIAFLMTEEKNKENKYSDNDFIKQFEKNLNSIIENLPIHINNLLKNYLSILKKINNMLKNEKNKLFLNHINIIKNNYYSINPIYIYRLEEIYLKKNNDNTYIDKESFYQIHNQNIIKIYNKDYLPNKLLDKSILKKSTLIEDNDNVILLYIYGLLDFIKKIINEQFDNNISLINFIFEYEPYIFTKYYQNNMINTSPDEYELVTNNLLYNFIKNNYLKNKYFIKICNLFNENNLIKMDDILLKISFSKYINNSKHTIYDNILINLETYLKHILIKNISNNDKNMRILLNQLQLYNGDYNETLMGHLTSKQYDTIYVLYNYIVENKNNNFNEYNNYQNNIDNIVHNSYFFNAHGGINYKKDDILFYLLKSDYNLHFVSKLFNYGTEITGSYNTIIGPHYYTKDNKLIYRTIDDFSRYSKGMFVPNISLSFKHNITTWNFGIVRFSKGFVFNKIHYYKSLMSYNKLLGATYLYTHGFLINELEVDNYFTLTDEHGHPLIKNHKVYDTEKVTKDILLRHNDNSIIPNDTIDLYLDQLNNYLNQHMNKNNIKELNIYFDSCRSNQFLNKTQNKNKLKDDPIIKVYKNVAKNIIKIKKEIFIKNNLTTAYNENINIHYSKNNLIQVLKNINNQTMISISATSLSSLSKDNGVYNIFEIIDELYNYLIFLGKTHIISMLPKRKIKKDLKRKNMNINDFNKIKIFIKIKQLIDNSNYSIYKATDIIKILQNIVDVYKILNYSFKSHITRPKNQNNGLQNNNLPYNGLQQLGLQQLGLQNNINVPNEGNNGNQGNQGNQGKVNKGVNNVKTPRLNMMPNVNNK